MQTSCERRLLAQDCIASSTDCAPPASRMRWTGAGRPSGRYRLASRSSTGHSLQRWCGRQWGAHSRKSVRTGFRKRTHSAQSEPYENNHKRLESVGLRTCHCPCRQRPTGARTVYRRHAESSAVTSLHRCPEMPGTKREMLAPAGARRLLH